jgi:hypothetical protein
LLAVVFFSTTAPVVGGLKTGERLCLLLTMNADRLPRIGKMDFLPYCRTSRGFPFCAATLEPINMQKVAELSHRAALHELKHQDYDRNNQDYVDQISGNSESQAQRPENQQN